MRTEGNRLHLGDHFAGDLVREFGSPLFVYEEDVLRQKCRDLRSILPWPNFRVNYSCKANTNIALMKIVREEGLTVDSLSPGEIFLAMQAGYQPHEILFIPNNVSAEEMNYAVERGIPVSVDSLAQLITYSRVNPGGEVCVRINPGIGEGHHRKVMTGGNAKFGIATDDIDRIEQTAAACGVTVAGLNMHIGSFFLTPESYIAAIRVLLDAALHFDTLKYIDFGGGFGIPYNKAEQKPFPMGEFGKQLASVLEEWERENGRSGITYILEPGRYPVAECGTILTTVHATKESFGTRYIGTDLGFNILIRPALYGAYHEVVVCDNVRSDQTQAVTICGNMCESGDLVCEGRVLPTIAEGNTLAVLDCGAYGFSMSSNYNARLRPAEILITPDGDARVIREREKLGQLLLNQVYWPA